MVLCGDKFKDVNPDILGAMVARSGEVETDNVCTFLESYVDEMGIETLCDASPGLPYILFVASGTSDRVNQIQTLACDVVFARKRLNSGGASEMTSFLDDGTEGALVLVQTFCAFMGRSVKEVDLKLMSLCVVETSVRGELVRVLLEFLDLVVRKFKARSLLLSGVGLY